MSRVWLIRGSASGLGRDIAEVVLATLPPSMGCRSFPLNNQ
ncbi:hypothetical protein SAMN04489802_5108 [Pseudomonas chlororaphis]|jgi:hypothetical protein|nr:hypothetical protein C4K20_1401 [Pseudomonas chlororaphis subsp. aurantiaca]AZD65301.1 hypothetical protein C4K17_1398 [Pseudomonas chlororaphis subsp. aurantiaca]AZD71775.1 hypothetical protein C4K16_1398 [Pseudomonas chlororaphis subsp. aurantiaca]SDT54027.1 hypothetical protein SAMN04489802_5108 [Pseudomonas chlororaphis]